MVRAGRNEHIAEIVTRYFICGLGAKDAVPVSFGEQYTGIHVRWTDGTRWNVLCWADFLPDAEGIFPPAAEKIRHWRHSLTKGALPILARVQSDAVILSGAEGFPISTFDLPAAA